MRKKGEKNMRKMKVLTIFVIMMLILNLITPLVNAVYDNTRNEMNATKEEITEGTENTQTNSNTSENNITNQENEANVEEDINTNETKEDMNQTTESEDESELEGNTINEEEMIQEETQTKTLEAGSFSISEGVYKIVTGVSDTSVLDIDGGSKENNANLQIWHDDSVDQQRFEITYLNNGYYKITALHSRMALDVADAGKADLTNVRQHNDNGSDAQQWIIQDSGDGVYYYIISKCNGLYLDVNGGSSANGTNVQMYTGHGQASQKFKFVKLRDKVTAEKTIEEGYYKIVTGVNNSSVLDISGGSKEENANVQIWQDNNVNQQKFEVTYLNNGYYKITALHSGKVLDVADAGKTDLTNVWQHTYNGTDAQQWMIQDTGDGEYYNIISKCNDLYLDVNGGSSANGTNVQMYTGHGQASQKFKFVKVRDKVTGEQTIPDGMYKIITGVSNNSVLDIDGGSRANGANLQIWKNDNVEQQKFEITYLNNGYYKITAVHSGKVLDVADAGKINLTNVWQHEDNGTDAQQWIIKDTGDGEYYNIISKCNDLYLDVNGGSSANGTNVQMYEGHGGTSQKFKFVPIGEKTIPNGTYKIVTGVNGNSVLDIDGGSKANEANLQIWQSDDVDQQKFKVTYLNNGYYKITALHSGKVLEVAGAGKEDSTNVWQNEDNGSDAQQWVIKASNDGTYYYFISKCNNLYLDVYQGSSANGTNVQMYTGHGQASQKFKFVPVGQQTIEDGMYKIVTGVSNSSVLDIAGGSKENNANLQIWHDDNVNQQKFQVTYLNNGYYKITAVHSGKVLDVENAGTANLTNVWQHEDNGTDAQQWIIQDSGDGVYYYVISKCNGLYLDVNGGSSANGTNVQMYEGHGGASQKFKFQKTTKVDEIYDDISTIDETKYPGFKAQLQAAQARHPNWNIKVYYTGLDWNEVIQREDEFINGSPKSLIHDSYENEWINGTDKYDVSKEWYRASQKAIAYMMDPRNSFDDAWIFQFQNLASSSGTKEEIEKMTEGTFLHNDSMINAIIEAANEQDISPFHIVSRILQEQGTDGSGEMNGYEYLGTTVYNLYNIRVSGDVSTGLLAGARYAYERGWFTPEASIKGGAEFLKTDYISQGQTTLYFQKYNVINQGNLFTHQYMQNIRAANDEGNLMYNAYVKSGILDSHFEFIIPIYENMPSTAAPRPIN